MRRRILVAALALVIVGAPLAAGAQQAGEVPRFGVIGEVSPTDPRGFATFALAGVWLIVAGRALAARTDLRRLYAQLAITAGIDLVLLFIATVVGSTPLILVFGGLASVVLGPIFWAMTGRLLTAP